MQVASASTPITTMQQYYTTQRLRLGWLDVADTDFIKELVNTPGWLQFIGDRNIHTQEEALAYVHRILNAPTVTYWVVRLREESTPVGIITFIKREYLQHYDIGFAFLPAYEGKGYAYEAVSVVLKDLAADPQHDHILATTIKENTRSVKLLEKLGLKFERVIEEGNETLMLYGAPSSQLKLD